VGIDRLDGLPAAMAGQVGRIGQWRDLVGRGPRRAERQLWIRASAAGASIPFDALTTVDNYALYARPSTLGPQRSAREA
jgi:hypothetical protein